MTSLEILQNKLSLLNAEFEQIKQNNLDEKAKLEAQLQIITQVEAVLNNEVLIPNFDFASALKIVASSGFNVLNLEKIINDVQNVLKIRTELNLSAAELPLEEQQLAALQAFNESLNKIAVKLNSQIVELQDVKEIRQTQEKINNFATLESIFKGEGKQKYVTEEMFADFYEEFDILNLPPEEAQNILASFYDTKNLNSKLLKNKADLDDVLAVYSKYLAPNYMALMSSLINHHKEEITTNIDLENATQILEFLQANNIIDKFQRNALLKITLYGKYEYIKNVIYPKITDQNGRIPSAYYKDDLATVWIQDQKPIVKRGKSFRTMGNSSPNAESDNLYTSCHTVDYDEFWKNNSILKANSDLFSEKINLDDLGSNLKLKTLPSWILKKNIFLCRTFGMGRLKPIPISCLENGDIEDKINLAIELGLFNPPMTEYFLDIDKRIVRNNVFGLNMAKKNIYNHSIRNYFQRNLSVLAVLSVNEYCLLTYKLQTMGWEKFYNEFFSINQAGQKNPHIITLSDRQILADKRKMDNFLTNNFMNEWNSEFINKYDEYDDIISEYDDETKKEDTQAIGYYNPQILEDELIKNLEINNTVNDIWPVDNKRSERKNEYVYMFGDQIISRYKVLHNATILKEFYGILTNDMLFAAIVRNSFLNTDAFQEIYNEVKERGNVR